LAVFFVDFSLTAVLLCVALYAIRMFGLTAGFHRYFSHRSYKTSRPVQFLMAVLGTSALQKGPLWWAAHHRRHHKYSDQPGDIHSPVLSGFWWSHVGWVISRKYEATDWNAIKDFARFPELRWLNSNHHYMASVKQGFFWWEIDFSYYALRVLSWLRLVWDLRVPPKHLLTVEAGG